MISLTQLIGIALCGMFACVVLKGMHSEMFVVCALATCAVALLFSLKLAATIMDYIERLTAHYNLADGYLQISFKVIGIGYVCTLASQLCRDAGQASIALQVELFGKLLILLQALPVAAKLIDTLTGIL